ncbi:MAG: ribonuclease R [Myxococcales bacterium]|nr:ribonuclease R [Myxococcales bacterium]
MTSEQKTILAVLRQAKGEGLKVASVLDELGMSRKEQGRIRRLLETMTSEGLLEKVARGTYAVAPGARKKVRRTPPETKAGRGSTARGSAGRRGSSKAASSVPDGVAGGPQAIGRIRVHPAGYGFVVRDDGQEDVFVPAKYRGSALDGDEVMLYTWQGFKGTEGRVEEVLDRGRAKLTGVIEKSGGSVYLTPDDPRIATDFGRVTIEGGPGEARFGECVVLEITQYPNRVRPHLAGRVVKVLGAPDDPRTEIQKIIICADIPYEMPAEVVALAEEVPQELTAGDFADRIDLRDRDFLTIDPETARDFDDAICLEDGPRGGPRVWIAVADVSHYVRPDDALDLEAQIRGVSVYLPDQVIPMLPMKLSAGICSLNPHVDRCAMVACLDYDAKNQLRETSFSAAVIKSSDRLDYPGVAAALSGDFRGPRQKYRKWESNLQRMHELAQTLRRRRRKRGTLELDIPEAKVVLDADNPLLVRDVVRSKGTEGVKEAYQLVEEFMIAANEAVGGFFSKRGLDTVWRIHAPPKEQRIEELAELLSAFGIYVDVEEALEPVGMKRVLDQVNKLPQGKALSFLVLRSLTQAIYDTGNVGHFGLASKEYIHFTSPIRRYPDLLAHRLMKMQLHKEGKASGGAAKWRRPGRVELQELAAACSSHERRAVEAEREAVAMYRAYVMREHVGEEFEGRVSGVTHFGAFVEIDAPFVEGLTKLDALGDDHFDFDPVLLQLSGRRTGFTLSLGDRVQVVVQNVSVALKRIEFGLAISEEDMEIAASRAAKAASRRERKPARHNKPRRHGQAKAGSRGKSTGAVNHRGVSKKKSGSKSSGKPGGKSKGTKPKGGKAAASKPGKNGRRKKR